VQLFRCMGSPAIIRLCRYISKSLDVATRRAGGLQPPHKRLRYSNRAVSNSNKRVIVKQVVYDEFMKQMRTVRHNFNTTGMTNYRVQLAVPLSIKNNYNHNNIVLKKS